MAKTFREMKKEAKSLGLNLWEQGGYYLMSGFIRGRHRQGEFSSRRTVALQLAFERKHRSE